MQFSILVSSKNIEFNVVISYKMLQKQKYRRMYYLRLEIPVTAGFGIVKEESCQTR